MDADNWNNGPIPNSYWVMPSRLAAGEYPGGIEPLDAARKVKALLGVGVNHFIDFTGRGELRPYREILEEEARRLSRKAGWARIPIDDLSVPYRPEYMAEILDAVDCALDDGKTVYVHCWGGVGRTGTVIGCWLVREGRTGSEALDQIDEWFQGMEKVRCCPRRYPHSPETQEQREYVRQWVEPSHKVKS